MKTLKFESDLAPKILSGEKTTTWRLWDDKDLEVGDEVEFINRSNGEVFTKATLTKVYEKPFRDLTPEDWLGHEEFPSREEMYKTYSGYYRRKVTPDTIVKIIHFRLT